MTVAKPRVADVVFTVPPTRKDAVLSHLRNAIIRGDLPPSTVIRDNAVAAELSVSITPVREAIAQLIAEGLISGGPARSRIVTAETKKSAADLLAVMEVITGAAMNWGTPLLTPAHVTEMRRLLRESVAEGEAGDMPTAGSYAIDIILVLVEASGNTELRTHVEILASRALRLLQSAPARDVLALWHRAYEDFLDLVEQGHTEEALERYRRLHAEFRDMVAP